MSIKLNKAKFQAALEIFPKTELVRIDETIARLSETYTAGEEKEKLNLTGIHGQATIVHMGDGDTGIITRVYLDGAVSPNEEVDGADFAMIFVSFTSQLRITTYSASAITAYCSESRITGFRRTT